MSLFSLYSSTACRPFHLGWPWSLCLPTSMTLTSWDNLKKIYFWPTPSADASRPCQELSSIATESQPSLALEPGLAAMTGHSPDLPHPPPSRSLGSSLRPPFNMQPIHHGRWPSSTFRWSITPWQPQQIITLCARRDVLELFLLSKLYYLARAARAITAAAGAFLLGEAKFGAERVAW